MARTVNLAPFRGLVTSLDSRLIPEGAASDLLNVMVEDGSITPRYGYRNIGAAQASFSAAYSLDYLRGFTSGGTEKEEYLSVQTVGGNTRPYSIHPTTGAVTEIKNGASSVALNASDWKAFTWNDYAYAFNPNNTVSVARHAIGDATSWTSLAVPAAGTTGATSQTFSTTTFTSGGYGSASRSGTGCYNTSSLVTGNDSINVDHNTTGTTTGPTTVTIDLSGSTAGIQDWTYFDFLVFSLMLRTGSPFNIDDSTIAVSLINNDGSPITLPATDIRTKRAIDSTSGNPVVTVECHWDAKNRTDFDNIRKIVFSYNVTAFSATLVSNNRMIVSAPIINRADLLYGHPTGTTAIEFGFTNYNSTDSLESDLTRITCTTQFFDSLRAPSSYAPAAQNATITLSTISASGDSSVDKVRWYYKDSTGVWRRFAENAKATTTQVVYISDLEAQGLPSYSPSGFKTDNVQAATRFKGWAIWGYKGGFNNVRHSRVLTSSLPLSAERQATSYDLDDDPNRGATFSLLGDDPLDIVEVGDGIVIVGSRGAYTQVGNTPSTMTPPRRVPMSKGGANVFCAARWRDANGNPACAYLTADGDMYLVSAGERNDGDTGFLTDELTGSIRGGLVSKLLTPQGLTSFATARVSVDEATDTLRVHVGNRAAVLRRKSLIDGVRDWEIYQYAHSPKYLAFSTQRRMKWIRTTGAFDENEWNSSTPGWITGSSRDGGSSMGATPYWESRTVTGENCRINMVMVERDSYTDTPTVTMTSSRQTSSKTLASGKRMTRFGALQQGWEHRLKVTLAENYSAVRRIAVEVFDRIGKRRLS